VIRGHPDYLGDVRLLAVLESGHRRRTDQRRRLAHPCHQALHRDAVLNLGARLCHQSLYLLDFAGNVPDGDLQQGYGWILSSFTRPPSPRFTIV